MLENIMNMWMSACMVPRCRLSYAVGWEGDAMQAEHFSPPPHPTDQLDRQMQRLTQATFQPKQVAPKQAEHVQCSNHSFTEVYMIIHPLHRSSHWGHGFGGDFQFQCKCSRLTTQGGKCGPQAGQEHAPGTIGRITDDHRP